MLIPDEQLPTHSDTLHGEKLRIMKHNTKKLLKIIYEYLIGLNDHRVIPGVKKVGLWLEYF